eukprot:scaffold158_cov388-Prasinococcus_capsulatus_cf.AAC.5
MPTRTKTHAHLSIPVARQPWLARPRRRGLHTMRNAYILSQVTLRAPAPPPRTGTGSHRPRTISIQRMQTTALARVDSLFRERGRPVVVGGGGSGTCVSCVERVK